jgi:uncharacterized protein YjiS (DUF1127 family)
LTALTTPALTTSAVSIPFGHVLAIAATVGARLCRRIVGAWRHRRDAAVLAGLDDHMLADLGLTRADLNDALSEPLWRDPTTVLARRQGERRWARHAAAADLVDLFAAPPIAPGTDACVLPPRDPPPQLRL